MGLGIEFIGRLRGLVVVADVFVVRDIISDQDFGAPVFGAALEHVHPLVFKDNFRINPLEALRAEAEGEVVIGVVSGRHCLEFVKNLCCAFDVSLKKDAVRFASLRVDSIGIGAQEALISNITCLLKG